MKNKKKLIIIFISVLLVISLLIACYFWYRSADGLLIIETTYSDSVYNAAFGHTYGNICNLYGDVYASYDINHPAYYLSTDNILYEIIKGKRQPISDVLQPMVLASYNFDQLTSNAWLFNGDATTLREQNVAAWYCRSDNALMYILLQENGDLLYCYGHRNSDIPDSPRWEITSIVALGRLD